MRRGSRSAASESSSPTLCAIAARLVPACVVAAMLCISCGSSSDSPSATDTDASVAPDTGTGGSGPDSGGDDADPADTSADGPTCSPRTCVQLGASCGEIADGCGDTLDCGGCDAPASCGGGGVEHQCGCTPKSCSQIGVSCGEVDTGCGTVNCGDCYPPDTCGGGSIAGQCGCGCTLPHAQASCLTGNCTIKLCDAGWADCDAQDANGCETDTGASVSDCGACGTTCAFANAAEVGCDQGSCTIVGCKPGFEDCDDDSANGCEANVNADPVNCGTCAHTCPDAGGTAACASGQCTVSNCVSGLGDCNPNIAGCETDLTTSVEHCGFCGNPCSLPNAVPACAGGSCVVSVCSKGFGDCDGKPENGCETNVFAAVSNCGACGNECVTPPNSSRVCVAGQCSFTCSANYADCNAQPGDGCELNVATNADHCGACGAACSANHLTIRTCQAGSCTGVCLTGYADCNGDKRLDGCEMGIASDPGNCGGCGKACSSSHMATVACSSGVCAGTCAAGWEDCNHNKFADGCEISTDLDPDNCGGCGAVCSTNHVVTRACSHGTCGGSCAPGWGNCNADMLSDGCETNLLASHDNCGTCGHGCGDCGSCSNGSCVGVPCR